MKSAQQQILSRAPRMLRYYTADGQQGIIPDTVKALKWAVEKRGANRKSHYTYHYFNQDGSGCDYLVGDFYCEISSTKKVYSECGVDIGPEKVITVDTILRTKKLLHLVFMANQLNCKCIYLGEASFGIIIPASVFKIEYGVVFLEHLYEEVSRRLSVHAGQFELRVSRPFRVRIENTPLPCGKFAISFLMDEFSRLPKGLEELASSDRDAPSINFAWTVNPLQLAEIVGVAVSRYKRHRSRKKTFWPQHPDQGCLVNFESVHCCKPSNVQSSQACARKLINQITLNKIMGFSQRDAIRKAGEKLHGESGNGGGVADALQILIDGHYVVKCHLPRIDYRCRRPAPWFLVNPLLYATPFEGV